MGVVFVATLSALPVSECRARHSERGGSPLFSGEFYSSQHASLVRSVLDQALLKPWPHEGCGEECNTECGKR